MGRIYLIRFEDGMLPTASDVVPGYLQASTDGELDITDPSAPTLYCGGVWREIEVASLLHRGIADYFFSTPFALSYVCKYLKTEAQMA